MEFDKSRVYTALNANELKVGSKVICANCLANLKEYVADYFNEGVDNTCIIASVLDETFGNRFQNDICNYSLAYLVSEPEEKDWIVYLCRRENVRPYLTSCRSDKWESVKEKYGAKTKLFEGTEDESEKWYEIRKNFTNEIAAWEDGKTIQFEYDGRWLEVSNPEWKTNTIYRIKPDSLKWTDLKLGDIVHEKNGTDTRMVVAIDTSNEPDEEGDILHVCLGDWWPSDDELEDWEKVEE